MIPASILEHEKTGRHQHVSTLYMPDGSKLCVSSGNSEESVELLHACVRRDRRLFIGPVQVGLEFGLPRPKTVTREYPSVKPDIDKLVRSVLDALTGPVLLDDSQVVQLQAVKYYAKEPGCRIFVIALPESPESAPEGHSTGTTARRERAVGATTR